MSIPEKYYFCTYYDLLLGRLKFYTNMFSWFLFQLFWFHYLYNDTKNPGVQFYVFRAVQTGCVLLHSVSWEYEADHKMKNPKKLCIIMIENPRTQKTWIQISQNNIFSEIQGFIFFNCIRSILVFLLRDSQS